MLTSSWTIIADMRAQTVTKLPLDTWARMMGLHPLHINAIQVPNLRQTTCSRAIPQYAWQSSDATSREDIAYAIAEAERTLEELLRYHLIPSWDEDEWHKTRQPYRPELLGVPYDVRGFAEVIPTRYKMFLSGGIRSQDLVQAGAAIAWSDEDADGYFETGTITCTTTALNPEELHVYYPGHLGDAAYEVRPVKAAISGTTATITFRRELCVIEEYQEAVIADAIPVADGTDDTDFLSEADVYRIYNDPQRQCMLLWEPYVNCTCQDGCALCAYKTQWACLHARGNRDLGLAAYTPAAWDEATLSFIYQAPTISRQPDAVRLYYYSGYMQQGKTVEMDTLLARAVTMYATTLLERPPCSCRQERFEYYQEDLAYRSGAEELSAYDLSPSDLNNPLGTRRGAVQAYKMLTRDLQPAFLQVAVL